MVSEYLLTIKAYLITGLDCGLDCWTGLLDLFVSHDFHPIKCRKFGYFLVISYTSLCMLVNVHECTMHNAQATWMDVYQELTVYIQ